MHYQVTWESTESSWERRDNPSLEMTEWSHWKWREYGEIVVKSSFILERKVIRLTNGIHVQMKEIGIIKDASDVR